MPEIIKKCTVNGWCTPLINALEDTNANKGLVSVMLIDLKTHSCYTAGVAYRGGDYGKKGVFIPRCPFCGTRLYPMMKKRKAQAIAEGKKRNEANRKAVDGMNEHPSEGEKTVSRFNSGRI